MSDATLLFAQLVVPVVTAVGCLALRNQMRGQVVWALLGNAAGFALAAWLVLRVDSGGIAVAQSGGWEAPFGITLVADRLSSGMLAISALIGLVVCIYSLRGLWDGELSREFMPLFSFLILGVQGAFLTGDLFNMYVWFEVMLVASFVLLTIGNKAVQLEGALKYVMLNIVGSVLFLVGAGLVYGKIGTLNLADIAVRLADPEQAEVLHSSGILLLVAFGLKAGLFPFFFWLPSSYHTPRVAVSAVFAGLLTKVGVYALIRTYTLFFAGKFSDLQELLMALAAGTMVAGVLGAAAHFEIRKILSFHIISQIGYMIMGLALMTPLALAAALFYLGHHIVVKTNLFLVGGIVKHLRGTGDLAKLGGLAKATPWLAVLFFVPAFSLAGIPPLSGFWAKLGVVKAGLESEAWMLTAVALAVGALTLFSMTKIWMEAFWKDVPEDVDAPPHRPADARLWPLVLPCVILGSITLWIGFAGGDLLAFAERAADDLLTPSRYIEAVLNQTEDLS
ncbi:MAG: Na+/H+ antiporter subunit D [Synoicihabitans sp.]